MKKINMAIMTLLIFLGSTANISSTDPANWRIRKIDRWFNSGEWSNGWTVTPDVSINRREFAISYFKNRERWNKAFLFLKNNNLAKLDIKRYDIEGDNLFAVVSEYLSKNEETVMFESHRKYIDIQYVVSGNEIMNVSPLNSSMEVLSQYDDTKDVEFVKVSQIVNYKANPANFFIFFPGDAHRPGLKDGTNSLVRKIVVKLKVD